jgi:hypothetical protein
MFGSQGRVLRPIQGADFSLQPSLDFFHRNPRPVKLRPPVVLKL